MPFSRQWLVEGLRGFRRNVRAGFRLAVFRRVGADDIETSWSQLVALIALNLALTLVNDLATFGLKGELALYGLPGVLFFVPISLIAAWALCALGRRPERTLTLMLALYALGIVIGLVYTIYFAGYRALPRLPRGVSSGAYYVQYAVHAWLALASAVAAIRMLEMRRARWLPALALVVIAIGLPESTVYRGSLWTPRYDPKEFERNRGLSGEEAFYQQSGLLERELTGLRPGRKGVIDLYLISVAGYASQDVFMREVNAVDKLFRERFDAEGRTVRLINNAKTVTEAPIASVTALKSALSRVAEVMDRDEDIVFVYLTSHGSEDHHFSLEFWPLRFKTLDPETLRKLLDESGIKRRVVVVSACYSGGFVEPLKDPNTLVITASAANRNSFGCSNEADFTYFGKAYFDEALRQTYSFVDAFEKAKPAIAEREKKEDFTGSQPQIYIGDDIVRPLALLEQQLKSGKRALPVAAPSKYQEFVDLWIRPELLAAFRKECLRGMAVTSPAYYVRKDPDYYGGMTERSLQWPRVMAAYAKYSEDYCAVATIQANWRQSYLESARREMRESDLDKAMQFLKTEVGRRYVHASNAAAIDATRRVTELSRPATDRIIAEYQDELKRITDDYRRGRQPKTVR